MDQEPKRIVVDQQEGCTIIRFRDKDILDQVNIHEMGEEMYAAVEGSPGINVVVDFDGVLYLSSSALGKLISLKRRVEENSGTIKMCRIKPEIMEVFRITKLDTIFDIRPDLKAALT
ncbi:MAG: STAS domain-containing protein [bacterium]|nr:STAS domain-containing protein [bacterium]